MKNILKYLVLLFGVAAFASSCTNDDVDYAWAEEESGLKLWFSETATTSYELAENQSSISFYLYRNQTDEALTVPINAECVTEEAYYEDDQGNVACIFEAPTEAVFAAGSDVAQMRVLFTFSEVEPERVYDFELAVADELNNSIYGAASLEFSIASYPDWEDAGWGTFDNPTMGLFAWPTYVEYMPIQHKAGTNLYRLPRYNAYWMESNMQTLIDDGTFADEAEFNEELEWQYSNSQHIVFQINDSNKSDGGNDWDFYNMAEGVQDDEASFLYGDYISDYFHGHGYMFATENYNSGYARYCSFWNDSAVDRKFYITYIFMYQGAPYNFADWVFDWKENLFYTGDAWEIKTNYNTDFAYDGEKEVAFTPTGFPELGTYNVTMQEASDKEGLFYLVDAFGVEGYGLAVFVNDDKVTIPADQPTGRVQNGMMVYAGPGGASMVDVDGNLKLNLEYYMIEEKTIMPEGDAEELPVQPDGDEVVPAVDPDDPRFEWPSGIVGVGERYEIVETPETPDTPAEPEPIVTTRRISLGQFEEIASTSGYAPTALEDFIGQYAITADNYGPSYLGDYAAYYPYVGEEVALNVTIAEGEKDDEVIITGLFSNLPNGDTYFADFAGKDQVVGVYNPIGGYVLVYPQTLKEKVTVLGKPEIGKPDREFAVNFTAYDVANDAELDAPIMLVKNGDALYIVPPTTEYDDMSYTFISDYDGGTMMNFDLPALPISGVAEGGLAPELNITVAIDEGTRPGRELFGNTDTKDKIGIASINGMLGKAKISWEVLNATYDRVVIDNGKAVVFDAANGETETIVNTTATNNMLRATVYDGDLVVAQEVFLFETYYLPAAASGNWVAKESGEGFLILGTGWNTELYCTANCTFNVYEKGSETPIYPEDLTTPNSNNAISWAMSKTYGVRYSGPGNHACHGGDGNNWGSAVAEANAEMIVMDGRNFIFKGLNPEKEYVVKFKLKVWPYIFDAENPNNKLPQQNASGQTVMNLFFKKMMIGGTLDTYYDAIDLPGEAPLTFELNEPEPEPAE